MPDGSQGYAGVLQTLREVPPFVRFALLGVFVNQFGAFLRAFLVLYMVHRGFSGAEAGLALGAYSAGAIAGVLAGGAISDRLGPRWTVVLTIGSSALLTLSITQLTDLPAIVVVVALAGAMTMAARPAIMALLLGSVHERRRVMVQAMYRTMLNAGTVAGPLMAAWLSTVNWNLVFYFDVATSLAFCIIAVFMLPRDHQVGPGAAGSPAEAARIKAGYLTMLRDARFLVYLVLMLANGLIHVQFYAVLPLMLDQAGYPTYAYSTAIMVGAGLVVGCELLVTKVTQRWPVWLAVLSGWLLLLVGYGMFGLPGGLAVVLAGTTVAAFGQVVGGPAAFAYPATVAPPTAIGRYIGTAHGTFQIGNALGPPAGVLLFVHLGRSFWGVCVLFGLVVAGLAVWGMRQPPGAAGPGRVPAEGPAGEPTRQAAPEPAETPHPGGGATS
jgi:MFS family permease